MSDSIFCHCLSAAYQSLVCSLFICCISDSCLVYQQPCFAVYVICLLYILFVSLLSVSTNFPVVQLNFAECMLCLLIISCGMSSVSFSALSACFLLVWKLSLVSTLCMYAMFYVSLQVLPEVLQTTDSRQQTVIILYMLSNLSEVCLLVVLV